MFGFTADETGANLPAEFGPWKRSEQGAAEIGHDNSLAGVGASGPVLAAVQREGFYMARSRIVVRDITAPTERR